MQITVDESVLARFPSLEIGYLVLTVDVATESDYVESLKKDLEQYVNRQNLNATNYAEHPAIKTWRDIYSEEFHVKPKQFKSSIEALVQRIVKGKPLWKISSIVDLYNCCSVMSMLPMGAYDLNKIEGDITLRYAKENEQFMPLGAKRAILAEKNHIVYSDESKLLCWLWNHKDSVYSGVDETTKRIIIFVDSSGCNSQDDVSKAVALLGEQFAHIGGEVLSRGILSQKDPISTSMQYGF